MMEFPHGTEFSAKYDASKKLWSGVLCSHSLFARRITICGDDRDRLALLRRIEEEFVRITDQIRRHDKAPTHGVVFVSLKAFGANDVTPEEMPTASANNHEQPFCYCVAGGEGPHRHPLDDARAEAASLFADIPPLLGRVSQDCEHVAPLKRLGVHATGAAESPDSLPSRCTCPSDLPDDCTGMPTHLRGCPELSGVSGAASER